MYWPMIFPLARLTWMWCRAQDEVGVWISVTRMAQASGVTKVLALAATVALLTVPVILFLGRTRQLACPQEVISPCDPGFTSPDWTLPAAVAAVGIGIALSGAAMWRIIKARMDAL